MLLQVLVFVHVLANVVWIGSIVAVPLVLAGRAGEAVVRGELAYEIYKKLAVPAFVVAFGAGLARLVANLEYYFVDTKFMHGKLTFALAVIALHHVIGARAKKVARGDADDAGPTPTLGVILLLCVAAAVFFAVLKPF